MQAKSTNIMFLSTNMNKNEIKKCFDIEYQTQWRDEVDFLKSVGIRYTFAKRSKEGISTYKYKKSSELFKQLAIFYANK